MNVYRRRVRWSTPVALLFISLGCDRAADPPEQDAPTAAAKSLDCSKAELHLVHVAPDGGAVPQGDIADESHTQIFDGCKRRAICRYHGGVMHAFGWHCVLADPRGQIE
jgi:hypothetical protein